MRQRRVSAEIARSPNFRTYVSGYTDIIGPILQSWEKTKKTKENDDKAR
jgi:hypothetical protein